MSKVTIKTVADKAKVSIKTVSRVINNEPSVRDSTREKIQTVIAELGYEPSPAARALASNTAKIIGLIYDNLSSAYVMAVQTGALNACDASSYSLVIHPCDHKSETLGQDLVNLVQKSRLDGLILTPPITDIDDVVKTLSENKINFVSIAPGELRLGENTVSSNDAEMSCDVTKHLIKQGHTQIGFVTGDPNHGAAFKRIKGYKKALLSAGIKFNQNLVYEGDFSFESGVKAGKALLQIENRPSAIFASNDYMAAGVLKVAHNVGLKVPQELSLVGFDDAPVSRQIWPSLTTVKQPVEAMAEEATKLLIETIKAPNSKPRDIALKSTLILRESTHAV